MRCRSWIFPGHIDRPGPDPPGPDASADEVVTVADSKNLPKRLDDTVEEGKVNEAFQQVAFADKDAGQGRETVQGHGRSSSRRHFFDGIHWKDI